MKTQALYSSPVRAHTPAHDRVRHLGTPARTSSPLRDSIRSPIRESLGSPMRESRMSPAKELRNTASPMKRGREIPLRLDDEDELVRALREHINLERELENAKITLV